MYNYNKSWLAPYDPTKLAILSILRPKDDLISNFGPNVRKMVSSDDVVHFIDEENIVTYINFGCCITFLPKTPTKIKQINRERKYISRSCEKRHSIPSNDQHTCFVDEQQSSNIFLNPYDLWGMVPAAPLSLRHTNVHTLRSISTLNQQLNNLEQTHIHSSLHCERWTVKQGIARQLCILSKKLLSGRTNERNSC